VADGFKWVFEIFDRFTGPTRQMAAALRGFDAGLGASKMGLRDFVGTLHDAMGTVRMLGGALRTVGEFATEGFKFAFGAASFKEDAKIGLETILRSKEEAAEVIKRAVKLAADTPLETAQTLDFAKRFIMGGFGKNDALTLVQAVSDVGSLHGLDPVKMQVFVDFLNKVQGFGHLTRDALSDMTRTGLLPMGKILEGIAKSTGMTVDQVNASIAGGTLDSATAIRGVLRTVADLQGGQLNNLSGQYSRALGGLLSTPRSRPFELLMGLDEAKGFSRVKGFVQKLVDMLDPSSATGQGLTAGIARMFDGLIEGFFGPLEGGTLEAKLDNLFKSLSKAFEETDWKALGAELRLFAEDLIYLAKTGVESIKTIASVPRMLKGDGQAWGEFLFGKKQGKNGVLDFDAAMRGAGMDAAKGMAQGLAAGAGAVAMGAQTGIVDPTISVPEEKLQIHSPSLKMRGLGRFASEGFQLGLQGSQSNTLAKSLDSFVSGAPGAIAKGHGGGGATVIFNINAPQESGEKIKALLVQALPDIFEGVALEVGAA
jgi:hypothetical protein